MPDLFNPVCVCSTLQPSPSPFWFRFFLSSPARNKNYPVQNINIVEGGEGRWEGCSKQDEAPGRRVSFVIVSGDANVDFLNFLLISIYSIFLYSTSWLRWFIRQIYSYAICHRLQAAPNPQKFKSLLTSIFEVWVFQVPPACTPSAILIRSQTRDNSTNIKKLSLPKISDLLLLKVHYYSLHLPLHLSIISCSSIFWGGQEQLFKVWHNKVHDDGGN